MARFRYKAVTSAGKVVEGALEAASRAAAIDHLRREGHLPIRAEEAGAGPQLGGLLRNLGAKRLSAQDIIQITRELATLLQAGLSLERALSLSGELAPGAQKEFLQAVLDAVRRGVSLSEALAAQSAPLPPFYVGLVQAGEAGGTLPSVLGRLADTLERSQALRESIRSALYYPVIVLVAAAAAGISAVAAAKAAAILTAPAVAVAVARASSREPKRSSLLARVSRQPMPATWTTPAMQGEVAPVRPTRTPVKPTATPAAWC